MLHQEVPIVGNAMTGSRGQAGCGSTMIKSDGFECEENVVYEQLFSNFPTENFGIVRHGLEGTANYRML
jgi:hypothetical protein